MEFGDWLKTEIESRGLGVRELARMAKLGSGTISRVINSTRKPGPEFCQAVARALKLPEEDVFRRAGLLSRHSRPSDPPPDPLTQLFLQLTPEQQAETLAYMRTLAQENAAREQKSTLLPAPTRI